MNILIPKEIRAAYRDCERREQTRVVLRLDDEAKLRVYIPRLRTE